jgi:hypothetical protein
MTDINRPARERIDVLPQADEPWNGKSPLQLAETIWLPMRDEESSEQFLRIFVDRSVEPFGDIIACRPRRVASISVTSFRLLWRAADLRFRAATWANVDIRPEMGLMTVRIDRKARTEPTLGWEIVVAAIAVASCGWLLNLTSRWGLSFFVQSVACAAAAAGTSAIAWLLLRQPRWFPDVTESFGEISNRLDEAIEAAMAHAGLSEKEISRESTLNRPERIEDLKLLPPPCGSRFGIRVDGSPGWFTSHDDETVLYTIVGNYEAAMLAPLVMNQLNRFQSHGGQVGRWRRADVEEASGPIRIVVYERSIHKKYAFVSDVIVQQRPGGVAITCDLYGTVISRHLVRDGLLLSLLWCIVFPLSFFMCLLFNDVVWSFIWSVCTCCVLSAGLGNRLNIGGIAFTDRAQWDPGMGSKQKHLSDAVVLAIEDALRSAGIPASAITRSRAGMMPQVDRAMK